jgi:hypoxanthine phosphoribosyltransferase
LGERVAEALALDFAEVLTRLEPKHWHGVIHALKQEPFVYNCTGPTPPMVLIVDDLATTGRTMRLSLEAVRAAGVMAFGFAYSGC